MKKQDSLFFISTLCISVLVSVCCQKSAEQTDILVLTKSAIDESAGNVPCYKIETPNAVYYLEKHGVGLSSLLDKDGNDWLGFHKKPGSGSAGEYRGFPNAVHQQDGSFFHPKNAGTDSSTTKVVKAEPDHIRIRGNSGNGAWQCLWDFYPTHCTFTMTKMPDGYKYWILYEGTPGGSYDDTDWWMTSAHSSRKPLTENHNSDIPAPEWIVFGDANLDRVLFLYSHQNDNHPDKFYQMNKQMTVFGFGRDGLEKFLDSVPRSFSIGFIPKTEPDQVNKAIQSLRN